MSVLVQLHAVLSSLRSFAAARVDRSSATLNEPFAGTAPVRISAVSTVAGGEAGATEFFLKEVSTVRRHCCDALTPEPPESAVAAAKKVLELLFGTSGYSGNSEFVDRLLGSISREELGFIVRTDIASACVLDVSQQSSRHVANPVRGMSEFLASVFSESDVTASGSVSSSSSPNQILCSVCDVVANALGVLTPLVFTTGAYSQYIAAACFLQVEATRGAARGWDQPLHLLLTMMRRGEAAALASAWMWLVLGCATSAERALHAVALAAVLLGAADDAEHPLGLDAARKLLTALLDQCAVAAGTAAAGGAWHAIELAVTCALTGLLREADVDALYPRWRCVDEASPRRDAALYCCAALEEVISSGRAPGLSGAIKDEEENGEDRNISAVICRTCVEPLVVGDAAVMPRRAVRLLINAALRADAADGPVFSSLIRRTFRKWGDPYAAKVALETSHVALGNAVMYMLSHRVSRECLKGGAAASTGGDTVGVNDGPLLASLLSGVTARLGSPLQAVARTAALIATQYSRLEARWSCGREETALEGGRAPVRDGVEPVVFDAFPRVVEEWLEEEAQEAELKDGTEARLQWNAEVSSSQSSAKLLLGNTNGPGSGHGAAAASSLHECYTAVHPDDPVFLFDCEDSGWLCAREEEDGCFGADDESARAAATTVVVPFGLTDLHSAAARGEPSFKYFRDAFHALTTSHVAGSDEASHEARVQAAVCALPEILSRVSFSRYSAEVAPHAAQALRSLLCLPLNYPPDVRRVVDERRQEAMALVVCCAPRAAMQEISAAMYSHNYTVVQRTLLMKVVAAAAQKLSSVSEAGGCHEGAAAASVCAREGRGALPPPSPPPKRVYPPIPSAPSEVAFQRYQRECASSSGTVATRVAERVEARTRRWGYAAHGRRRENPDISSHASCVNSVNELAEHALDFVHALALRHDSGHYKLLEEPDVYMGGAVLHALTIIVTRLSAARHVIGDVALAAIRFELEITCHANLLVRQAAWAAVVTALEAWCRGGAADYVLEDSRWAEASTLVELRAAAVLREGGGGEVPSVVDGCARGAAAAMHFLLGLRETRLRELQMPPLPGSLPGPSPSMRIPE